jgi:hypothetical protein
MHDIEVYAAACAGAISAQSQESRHGRVRRDMYVVSKEEEEVGSGRVVVVHATSVHAVSMDMLFAARVCAG